MAWAERTYLQLVIKGKVEIDMMHYPTPHIIPPRLADKEHATRVIEGWKSGVIKWVMLSETDLDARKEELAKIPVVPRKRKVIEGGELE